MVIQQAQCKCMAQEIYFTGVQKGVTTVGTMFTKTNELSLILKEEKDLKRPRDWQGIWNISKRKEQEYGWHVGVVVGHKDKLQRAGV